MEWMLHTTRNIRNLPDWSEKPSESDETVLSLILKPVERKLGDLVVKGFSYQYSYKSQALRIYKITDLSSWEIDGTAVHNKFWMRGSGKSIFSITDNSQRFSTEYYLQGIANPNIFQFLPFQTQMQGFTFTESKKGVLLTIPSKVAHIRSLFEKWKNKDELVHFHEHCGDLTNEFQTSPVEVYWIPGEKDSTQTSNLYYDVRESVHNDLHEQVGMKRERISTYGLIEEWTEPDFDYYTRAGLKKLLDLGIKKVFIANHCQNTMNTWGLQNMCCNVDFKISEVVGEDKIKKFL
ncbi:MAG: hypothetical protein HC906_03210 [Bacteroidales bacterium]|nr:hypothetical protein [Bacteroidales bacterium]